MSVAALLLTASGGPFLRRDRRRSWLAATPEDALTHPTWTMGAKITIDSATLMNKGLEVIEAHWLYDVDYDAIEVVIHPQSVVHSAVRFVDGSLKAQLGTPGHANPHPVRHDLPRTPAFPGGPTRPDRDGSARLPCARSSAVPGAAHRPRGRASPGRAPPRR